MVEGGMTCVKYLLFAFNLVFVIFGILLLYSGFATIGKISDYKLILEDAPSNVAITLIIIGFFIFLIAFLGCCGAIRENYCMLITFSSIILMILLIEVVGAGLVLTFKSKLKDVAKDGFEEGIKKYNVSEPNKDINVVLDDLQHKLKCCGANNASDWAKNNQFNASHPYPYSCCVQHNTTDKDKEFCGPTEQHYTKGCVGALDEQIRGSLGMLGGIAIAIAIIQLIGIVFSCALSRSIKRQYEVV